MPDPAKTAQPELDLDHCPALETQMRTLFEFRWARWHRAKSFEEAMQDPVTRRLLALAVLHSPSAPTPRRRNKPRTKPSPEEQPA